MRIIVIIKKSATGSTIPAFLTVFAIFSFVFSQDGDREVRSKNTIQGDTKCFTDSDSYKLLVDGCRNLSKGGSAYSADVDNALLSSLGIVRVSEGEEVIIQGPQVRDAGQFFTPVSLIEHDNMSCLIDSRLVQMSLWQWVRWRTTSLFS